MSDVHILRLYEVIKMLGVSKSTIYKWMKDGDFPRGILLGPNCRGWLSEDITNWLSERSER